MRKLVFVLPLLLIACTTPQTPAQSVFAAGTSYKAAAEVALTYIRLPRCSEAVAVTCSKQSVVDEIKRADNVAHEALTQARAVVADPSKTATLKDAAVSTVTAALATFTAVLDQYEIGGAK